MVYSVENDVIQDMIAMYGRERAIQELLGGLKAVLDDIADEIESSK